jgi:hypothetical protein
MRPRRAQQGIALVVILAALFMVGAYFLYASLNLANVRVERDRETNDALGKAKAALIAYAVADTNRPGELPCPDVNDDGQVVVGEDTAGSNCASLIGRLPWKTLGLPDLRDDSGERLWYALSNDFHANGTVALNSDTAYRAGNGSLAVRTPSGVPTSPNGVVVAIVFSPGSALQRSDGVSQSRACTVGTNCDATLKCTTSPASLTPKCNPQNYLDKEAVSGEDNADLLPAANPRFATADRGETFNDRLMPVYSDDIMSIVEKRAAREVAQVLKAHYAAWEAKKPSVPDYQSFKGFYPWAAQIVPASTDPALIHAGTNAITAGLVPFDGSTVRWSSASTSLLSGCSGINTTQLTCTGLISLFSVVGFNISARVGNIGSAATTPPEAADVTVSNGFVIGTPTITWTLVPGSDALDFSYSGTVFGIGLPMTVQVQAPAPMPMPSWIATNNWQERMHYAVAPAYALTGSQDCGTMSCISVSNTTAAGASAADKQAILLMTGRALVTRSYPPLDVAQYLEGGNVNLGDNTVDNSLRTTVFNDTPYVVAP